jgi:prophage maintenance system killer protein
LTRWDDHSVTSSIDASDLLALATAVTGGESQVRDIGLFDMAVRNVAAYDTLWLKAAALIDYIVTTRPLVEGNWRLGWMAAVTLCDRNGWWIDADEDEALELVREVGRGTVSVAEMAASLEAWAHLKDPDFEEEEGPSPVPPVDRTVESDVTFPISVYLADEASRHNVEAALESLLWEVGIDVVERDDPVIGSWFRRLKGRIRDTARSPIAQELADVMTHAADSRAVLAHDATVTANLMQNLGPLLTSLQPTKDAVLRVGALLIVKVDWTIAVHQLTAAQQLRLNHQPQLLTSPSDILHALDLNPNSVTDHLQRAQPVRTATKEAVPIFELDRNHHRLEVAQPAQRDDPTPRTETQNETDWSTHLSAIDVVHDPDYEPGALPDPDDLGQPPEQPRESPGELPPPEPPGPGR